MNRFARLMAISAAAASVVAAGSATAASASVGGHAASGAAAMRAAALAALRGVTANPPATDRQTGSAEPGTGGLRVRSTNWSGYADTHSKGNTYTKVSGGWTEPAVSCPTKELQLAVFWVGIDGYSSPTVEQDGTLAECFKGKAFYFTWWEMYPTNDIQVVGTTVRPGDKIAASVVKSGGRYRLTVTDSTTRGNNISERPKCSGSPACADSSAEWIAEAPGGNRGEFPLPDFGRWTLSSASVTSGATTGTISAFPDARITMVGSAGYRLAAPGALNSPGNGFTDTWYNSY